MPEVLEVKKRDQLGTLSSKRLRRSGHVPAVLYGHGESNEHLAVPDKQVKSLIRHHVKTVELTGDVKDTALVRNIQWDALGIDVLHLDLIRVNLKEKVEVIVPIHTVGDSIGVREGGILIENMHQVQVRCLAGAIPDRLNINISNLALGGHLTAGDLILPEDVELVTPAESVVIHVEGARGDIEEAGHGVGVEPEVIAKGGEKKEA